MRGVVIEAVAGRRLEVPGEFACARFDCHNARRVETVAVAAERAIPRGRVAGSEEEQVEVGIVDHAFPRCASAACFPPLLSLPGLGGCFHGFRFEALSRIGGDGVEAPGLLACFRVVGGDIAAHSVLRACVADDDLISRDAWRRGDGIGRGRVGGLDAPHRGSAALVERDEPAVERADIDLAIVEGDAAVYDVAAEE